jgi:transposase
MPQSFIACDREQAFLMPPDVREWLPEGHLAWFVLDAIAAIDLTAFYAAYREDGRSRPAYEPSMMVALMLYAYARGVRSARAIERACEEDVAYRVIAAHQKPDHATVARFVERHEQALAGLFGSVLGMCAQAGLAKVGLVAIDGTKVQANASRDATRDYEQIAREILEEAKAVDAAEDELYGEARGDELPPELATAQGRKKWLRAWQRRLDDERAEQARPIPQSRPKRLKEAKRRLDEELWTECQANAAYEGLSRARGDEGRPPVRRAAQALSAAGGTAGQDQPHRPGLAAGQGGCADGCRATTPRRPPTSSRSLSPPRSPSTRPTSATSNRSLTRPAASLTPPVSAKIRRSCWPMPATGTKTRWSDSSLTASRC